MEKVGNRNRQERNFSKEIKIWKNQMKISNLKSIACGMENSFYGLIKKFNKAEENLSLKICHGIFTVHWFTNFPVVQSLSRVWLSVTPWAAASQAPLSSTISWSLLKFMSIDLVMPYNHLILGSTFSFCFQSFSVLGSFPMSWSPILHVAKVLELQLQYQSFQWIFKVDFL